MSTVTPDIQSLEEIERWATHDRRPFFEIALRYCGPDSRVLDVGSGAGDFARLVPSKNLHLVDWNEDTVAQLRREFPNVVRHVVPDPFPYQDGFFNVVHCSHLVEHLIPEHFYQLLREVDRVLAVDGVFVVSAPLLWHGFYDDLSHVRPYPPQVFRKYMCSRDARNPTRSAIAGSYKVESLQYRYTRRAPSYFDVSTTRKWAKRAMLKATSFLRRIAFARYEVSGFTLALRKVSA